MNPFQLSTRTPMKLASILILTLLFIATSCNDAPTAILNQTQVVVQAYIYEGAPVRDVYISASFAVGSDDSANTPIQSANVVLTRFRGASSERITLRPIAAKAGYYEAPDSTWFVGVGDSLFLEVKALEHTATASTTVPRKPEGVAISRREAYVRLETRNTPFGTLTTPRLADAVQVSWQNPNAEYFYTILTSIDTARIPLRADSVNFNFIVSEPATGTTYNVRDFDIRYTGRHLVNVYRINKEYADLYKSRSQDSRTLSEPLTNIRGGLGIFTAFASDTATFIVRRED
jgi:hypothetical protein